jgi:small subunit ribosomal protein S16
MKQMGRRHRPYYRICAVDGRAPRDGRVIEELGTYDPMVKETDARCTLDGERVKYWLGVGAQPSDKVKVLIKKYGPEGTHLAAQQSALERLAAPKVIPDLGQPVYKPKPPPAPAPETKKKEAPAEPTTESPKAEAAAETTEATESPKAEAAAETTEATEPAEAAEAQPTDTTEPAETPTEPAEAPSESAEAPAEATTEGTSPATEEPDQPSTEEGSGEQETTEPEKSE